MSEVEKLKKVNLSITKKYTASKKMVEDKMKTISDQKSIIRLFKGTEDVLKSTIKNLESKIKDLMGDETPYPRGQGRSSSQNNNKHANLLDKDFSVSILDSSKFSKTDSYRHPSPHAHTQQNQSEKPHLTP
jgi:predicted  nucleic acid-binding Zn-ribbon protein